MKSDAGPLRRFLTLALCTLGWAFLGNSAHAFATSSYAWGLAALVASAACLLVAIRGKLAARVQEGTVAAGRILMLAVIPLLIIAYEVGNLTFSRVQLLGAAYIPGIILLVTSLGSILLSVLMLVPIAAMLRTTAPKGGPPGAGRRGLPPRR